MVGGNPGCVCVCLIPSQCVPLTLGSCRLMVKGDSTCHVVTCSTLTERLRLKCQLFLLRNLFIQYVTAELLIDIFLVLVQRCKKALT